MTPHESLQCHMTDQWDSRVHEETGLHGIQGAEMTDEDDVVHHLK